MKRKMMLTLFAGVLAGLLFADGGTKNLIINGNFEEAEGELPSGWSVFGASERGVVARVAKGRDGAGLSIVCENNDPSVKGRSIAARIRPIENLPAGKGYTLSLAARSPIAGQKLIVFYYTDPRDGTHWYTRREVMLSKDWRTYRVSELIPPDAEWRNKALSFNFLIESGSALIDDVSFAESTPPRRADIAGKNLLMNGDFENNDGNTLFDWVAYGSLAGKGSIGARAVGFVNGSYSAEIKSLGIDPTTKDKMVVLRSAPVEDIIPGEPYTLTFYARGESDGQPLIVFYYTDSVAGLHWYKREEFVLSREWKRYTFAETIPGPEECKARSLYFHFAVTVGTVLLDDVSFMIAERAVKVGVRRKNILVNPGFDTGVDGWFTETWHSTDGPDQRSIEIDRTNRHSGTASVKLYGLNNSIISRLYPFVPGRTYALSLYARNEESGTDEAFRMFSITPDWKIERRIVMLSDLGTEWKRFSIEFKYPALGGDYQNSFYVRVDPKSTVWIDSMQVEEGQATPYDPGIQVGVMPRAQLGIYQPGNITADVVVTSQHGLERPALLSVICADVNRRIIAKQEVPLESSSPERIVVPVSFTTNQLGVIDIATAVYDATDRVLLAEGSWRIAIADPINFRNRYIGIDLDPGSASVHDMKMGETIASYFGADFQRTFMRPGYAPRSRFLAGDNVFLDTMNEMLPLQRRAMMMTVVNPPADSILNYHQMLKAKRVITDDELSDEIARFGAMFAHIAARLSKHIGYFEILNEPNLWTVAGEKGMTPERYAQVVKEVAPYVRAAVPNVKLAANVNGIDHAYAERFFAAGGGAFIDVFTVHPYRGAPENPPMYEDFKRLRTIIDKYQSGMPIINSEQYYGVRNQIYAHEYARNYYADDEEDCAGRIVQTLLHGVAAERAPFSLHGPTSSLFKFSPFDTPYYYYLFGLLNAGSRLMADVTNGTNITAHNACRAFLFEKADGTRLVSINTRVYGTEGFMKRPPLATSVLDANGNALPGDLALGYLPTYLTFAHTTSSQEIKTAVQSAMYRGFDFPLSVFCDLTPERKMTLIVENTENAPVSGNMQFIVPEGFASPGLMDISLGAGERRESSFVVTRSLDWRESYAVSYTGKSGDMIVSRTVRLPSLFVPRTPAPPVIDGDLADWTDVAWLSLGEDSLSTDFNPKNPHTGPSDLAAEVAIRYDASNVYLAVNVKDETFFRRSGGDQELFSGDSVQVYFDLKNTAREDIRDYDADDAVYSIGLNQAMRPIAWLEKNPGGTRYLGGANEETGIDTDVRVACRKTAAGYVYEMAFPGYTLPFLALASGSIFGISLLINDNDGAGRKQGLTLGPKGTEPCKTPFLWRCARLSQ
jgi:hypothetical protein